MIKEEIFNLFANVQIGYLVDSEKVVSGDTRLDSSHFIDDVSYTVNSNLGFTTLSEFIQDVEEPTLFTRIYCDKEFGVPYISSSEMSEIEPPVDSRFISKTLTKNIEQYIIKRGQILVSAAGTVGSIVVATEELDGVAGTSDILRINLDQSKYLGFIYTYLTSSFGANELSNLAYGAIVKRVRGFQLAELKTPFISPIKMQEMNELILRALEYREKSNKLVKDARNKCLSRIQRDKSDRANKTELGNEIFNLNYNFVENIDSTSNYRLNPHYYSTEITDKISQINKSSLKKMKLQDICNRVFICYRFPRNFVDSDNGIPLIGTSSSFQIRPIHEKYLSKEEVQNKEDLIIKKNWLLLARVGTYGGLWGKVSFVWQNFENCVASDNIIRIIPDENKIDPGYLFAYLSSEIGYTQITQLKHGAAQAALDFNEISQIDIPILDPAEQKEIGDLVRKAYELRAEAIKLEDEAQELLTQALTQA
jgi:type I restriction enzyme S subunit